MEKSRNYNDTFFTPEVLTTAATRRRELAEAAKKSHLWAALRTQTGDTTWTYDTVDEFMADYRQQPNSAHFSQSYGEFQITVMASSSGRRTEVSVKAPQRAQIESVFSFFDAAADSCRLPESEPEDEAAVIFIGHGRSGQWRDLRDHLQDKHGYEVEAYETGARAGRSITDILDDMANSSDFALLVLTAEDEHADGTLHARENVIHEVGLFQGRLSTDRAIVLLEEGVNDFSNIHGVQYIPFRKGAIKETFGEVLATLRREFEADAD